MKNMMQGPTVFVYKDTPYTYLWIATVTKDGVKFQDAKETEPICWNFTL